MRTSTRCAASDACGRSALRRPHSRIVQTQPRCTRPSIVRTLAPYQRALMARGPPSVRSTVAPTRDRRRLSSRPRGNDSSPQEPENRDRAETRRYADRVHRAHRKERAHSTARPGGPTIAPPSRTADRPAGTQGSGAATRRDDQATPHLRAAPVYREPGSQPHRDDPPQRPRARSPNAASPHRRPQPESRTRSAQPFVTSR
jgi:hypothetical protein